MTRAAFLLCAVAALAAPARADLAREADLNAGLQIVATGNFIRRACPEIEARRIRGLAYLRSLAVEARRRGYSDDVIRAYVEDDAAKAVVEGQAMDYLRARGLGAAAPEDFCRVGRAEIAGGTPVGDLLRLR